MPADGAVLETSNEARGVASPHAANASAPTKAVKTRAELKCITISDCAFGEANAHADRSPTAAGAKGPTKTSVKRNVKRGELASPAIDYVI